MTSSTGPLVAVRDLHKSYGDHEVLKGVSFAVPAGSVYALLGPNGAGKTTTVEILEGYRRATSGVVEVLGLAPTSRSAELRQRVGIVLQECGFPSHLRVSELIDAWRGYFTNPLPATELLRVVDLEDHSRTFVRILSGGQRRRLDLALALAGDPDLIFLDEPTTGFDPEARRRCWHAIENLRDLGKTVLLTTHYLDEAEHLADTVAVLDSGRICASGSPRELSRSSQAPTRIAFTPTSAAGTPVECPSDLVTSADGGRCHILASDVQHCLRRLFEWAEHSGSELVDLSVTPPSLEDAYLHLVASPQSERP